jgi:hypothetical protein
VANSGGCSVFSVVWWSEFVSYWRFTPQCGTSR